MADNEREALRPDPEKFSPTDTIRVHISFEIIRLFSEGLYQSPHKAIEELVSNSYDANARHVHVLLPDEPSGEGQSPNPLWVLDDGDGMDAQGFHQLWRVADSPKANIDHDQVDRPPIGQFGIGKLAAYVLAWRLTHLSKVNGRIHHTQMNFRDLTGKHQYEDRDPVGINLYEVSEDEAKRLLADVESRDPAVWARLFGPDASESWTAAALSDFKNLYDRLSSGRLGWVLRTGLPLHSDFQIWLNGEQLISAKEGKGIIQEIEVGGAKDSAARKMNLTAPDEGIKIEGIPETITGVARIFEKRLTTGKSEQYGRSNGFFIRVRGRVINLEDELFGLDALNHAAWSRFAMEVDADGLREHLLSSREGIRESESTRRLRKYLNGVFNICRNAFDEWSHKELVGLDVHQLLSDAPSLFVTEPLIESVQRNLEIGAESFYITKPDVGEETDKGEWLRRYQADLEDGPFSQVLFEPSGEYDRPLRYIPETRSLIINIQHPFIDKLVAAGGRSKRSTTLFGTSELLMDVLLQDHGMDTTELLELMKDRDRILRVVAGEHPSTAAEVLRLLKIANRDETVMERAVGSAFKVLGFEYERLGENRPGPDGILYARLGRGQESLADYKVVYDAKQTNQPKVPADKINLGSIDDFRDDNDAQFAFFIAIGYAAEDDPKGKVNRLVSHAASRPSPQKVTLLRLKDLQRIVELHYQYGVPLTQLRELFENAHTVPQVIEWIEQLQKRLTEMEPPVPLRRMLKGLEDAKRDEMATPNIKSVRTLDDELQKYTPEKLYSTLRAVETIVGRRWIEVQPDMDVRLHHSADQVLAEVERNLHDLFGAGVGDLG